MPRIRGTALAAGLLLTLAVSGCRGPRPPLEVGAGWSERGVASWYGPGFDGRRTASGEAYDMWAMTAAHKRLPFGTIVEVTNRDNGRRVEVRINDRGPFAHGRVIDLSRAAAEAIGMVGTGTARVVVRVVDRGRPAVTVSRPARPARWVVQVAAFHDPYTADRLAEELQRRGHGPVAVAGDGLWYRVLVGPFEKEGKAGDRARRLRRDGYSALVRPELSVTRASS
jgi:rare lipoprotein A